MSTHPLAGNPTPRSRLVNVPRLIAAYYTTKPDPSAAEQRVVFGTSGHRGSSLRALFNEAHLLAITQAICLYRPAHRIDGPLYLGKDTHAPEGGAPIGGLKVVTANGWFAARPSGADDVHKIYAESFVGPEHLAHLQQEARPHRGRVRGRRSLSRDTPSGSAPTAFVPDKPREEMRHGQEPLAKIHPEASAPRKGQDQAASH